MTRPRAFPEALYDYEVTFEHQGQRERVYVSAAGGIDAVCRAEQDLPEGWENATLVDVQVTGLAGQED